MEIKSPQLHHGRSRLVTLDEMEAIPAPQGTDTWRPVPHRRVVDAIHAVALAKGLSIAKEEYSITGDDARMFGVLKLEAGNGEWSRCVGIRNGNDKTLAFGVAIGVQVLVCDNRCFSGERVFHRRHTSNFEVEGVVQSAFEGMDVRFDTFENRLNTLKGERISHDDAVLLIVKVAEEGGVPGSHVMSILQEFTNPRHSEFSEPTKWNLLNAFTEISKRYRQGRYRTFQRTLAEAFQLG
jgi:hypothetical protein